MPTKARRIREAERQAEQSRIDDVFSTIPEYMQGHEGNLAEAVTGDLSPEFRLKGGLRTGDENGELVIRYDKMREGAALSNADKTEERQHNISRLRKKYSDDWGVRGRAKRIAADEGLSIRTVQQYFKDSK